MILQLLVDHLFQLLYIIPLCKKYHNLFILSIVSGHLCSFQDLAFMNNAAMNILLQVFLCLSVGYTPRNATAGSQCGHIFSFSRYTKHFKSGFSPVTFSCVFFTCDFHLPTLASLTWNLNRANQLGTAQLQPSPH